MKKQLHARRPNPQHDVGPPWGETADALANRSERPLLGQTSVSADSTELLLWIVAKHPVQKLTKSHVAVQRLDREEEHVAVYRVVLNADPTSDRVV